jgi:NAD(P)H-dependent flavin oxidoreductase YrpB (nitropropane dioxygenase family)
MPVREMLAQAEQADVIMAPAADMFEMGVKLQVLKRGTMFAMRAAKLYELYRA